MTVRMPSDLLFTLGIPMPSRPIHGKLPCNCFVKVRLAERVCLSVFLRLQRGHRSVIACLPDILSFGIAAVQSVWPLRHPMYTDWLQYALASSPRNVNVICGLAPPPSCDTMLQTPGSGATAHKYAENYTVSPPPLDHLRTAMGIDYLVSCSTQGWGD